MKPDIFSKLKVTNSSEDLQMMKFELKFIFAIVSKIGMVLLSCYYLS